MIDQPSPHPLLSHSLPPPYTPTNGLQPEPSIHLPFNGTTQLTSQVLSSTLTSNHQPSPFSHLPPPRQQVALSNLQLFTRHPHPVRQHRPSLQTSNHPILPRQPSHSTTLTTPDTPLPRASQSICITCPKRTVYIVFKFITIAN